MLESLSGRFPRFIWSDPTCPFADPLRLETALRERIGPTDFPTSSIIAAVTAMAGHLRGRGESREGALAAVQREVQAVSHRDQRSSEGAVFTPEITDEIVRLAIDTCYGPIDQETRAPRRRPDRVGGSS
jgi:hypothetical protein